MNLRQIVPIILINVVLLAAVAFASHALIIETRGLRFDFYPHIIGGRAVWHGENPYDPAVTERIQMGMFGRLLPPDADQQNMAYPAYSSIVLGPVVALPDQAALAVWTAIQFIAILWTPVLWLQILGWKPHPVLAALLFLGLLFVFRYPIDTFVLGQFSGTVLFSVSLGFLLLMQGDDIAAGVVLVLATIPPTMGAPLAVSILIAYALRGRWRGLAAFVMTLVVLTLFTFVLIGNWIPDYLSIIDAYQDYAVVSWAVDLVAWLPLQVIFVAGLLGYSLFMLWCYVRQIPTAEESAVNLVVTALIVSLLLIPQTGEYYLVLLIPALIVMLYRAGSLTGGVQWLVRLSVLLVMISPWLYARGETAELPTLAVPLHVLVTWVIVLLPIHLEAVSSSKRIDP